MSTCGCGKTMKKMPNAYSTRIVEIQKVYALKKLQVISLYLWDDRCALSEENSTTE